MTDGTNNFYVALLPLNQGVTTNGIWYTVNIPLSYSVAPWYGGTSAEFSNMLTSVSEIDIDVSRNGAAAQSYYIDNFRIVNDIIFVPEPTSGLFWFGWALVFGGLRRKLTSRRHRSPYALPAVETGSVA